MKTLSVKLFRSNRLAWACAIALAVTVQLFLVATSSSDYTSPVAEITSATGSIPEAKAHVDQVSRIAKNVLALISSIR